MKLAVKPGQQAVIDELVQGSRNEAENVSYDHFKKIGSDTDYEIIEH